MNPVPKGEDGVFASSVIDTQKQEIIVKVINTTGEAQQLTIQLTGLSKKQLAAIGTSVSVTSLDCSDYDAENQPGRPEVVSPKSSTATLVADKKAASLTAQLPAKTFQVYRVKL